MNRSKQLGTSLAERLWSRVVPQSSGCHEWTGYIDKQTGYGQIGYGSGRRPIGTHVAAWLVTHGQIPAGLSVLHRCDNRPCCNPDHLFLGSQADNAADMGSEGSKGNGESGREQA